MIRGTVRLSAKIARLYSGGKLILCEEQAFYDQFLEPSRAVSQIKGQTPNAMARAVDSREQGLANGEMGFRGQFARQQS
jgi:hypothetical protein